MMPPMPPRANLVSQLMRVSVPEPSSLSQRPEMLERRTRFLIVRFSLSFNGLKIASIATDSPLMMSLGWALLLFGRDGHVARGFLEFLACEPEQVCERIRIHGEFLHLGLAELAIAFELALAEELVERRLMRKGVVRIAI